MPRACLLAALAVCSIALAACGSSSKPSSFSTARASGSAQTQAATFAHCMRSNGVTNYPDPSRSGRPHSLNQVDLNSPAFRTAHTACRKDLTSGQIGPPAPTAAQLGFARSFAHCIRKHGFPQFPDPLTTYGPGFTLGRGEYFPDNSTYQVQSPEFVHSAKFCGVQLPSGLP
jgi:hypothetical protein